MIRRGVYCTPGGKIYLSLAHSDADLESVLARAEQAVRALVS
jgi:glutamate-1-semialdehyde aminotransferase